MNTQTLSKIHLFGKLGKIIATIIMIITVFLTVIGGICSAFLAVYPMDGININMTNKAEFQVRTEDFDKFWSLVGGNFSYAADIAPEELTEDSDMLTMPPEDQEFGTAMSFLDQSYDRAIIHTDGDLMRIEAESDPTDYSYHNLVPLLVSFTFMCLAAFAVLWMLRRLFAQLAVCETPFSDEFVNSLRAFTWSLIPLAILSSIMDTLANTYLTAANTANIEVEWGLILAFIICMFLVTVFRYGVQLQKESDETL